MRAFIPTSISCRRARPRLCKNSPLLNQPLFNRKPQAVAGSIRPGTFRVQQSQHEAHCIPLLRQCAAPPAHLPDLEPPSVPATDQANSALRLSRRSLPRKLPARRVSTVRPSPINHAAAARLYKSLHPFAYHFRVITLLLLILP